MKIVLAIDPAQPVAAYRAALLGTGARPEEVEVVQPGGALPVEFDGLLIAGGVDVEPSRYGETPLNGSVETNPARDELDFELFARARRAGVPVFGICRGLQVVNVALGGTLWQDLPTQRPRGVEHSFPRKAGNDPAREAHVVRASPGVSRRLPLAAELAAADGLPVNSRHHQAVKDVAQGLVSLAASPDDLVEALASGAGPFLAAVQWHPENLVDRADQRALFSAFLESSRRRADGLLDGGAPEEHETPAALRPSPREGGERRGGPDTAPERPGAPEPE